VGLTKALEIAYENLEQDTKYIQSLKDRLIKLLTAYFPDISFNGNSANTEKSLYTVLSVNLPDRGSSLLQALDQEGVAVSGGSACCTGSTSHVLNALNTDPGSVTVRFSFSKFNTIREIDYVAGKLAGIYQLVAA
jgi:cysteine desulfurase